MLVFCAKTQVLATEIFAPNDRIILLVGIKATELAIEETSMLHGKKIIEISSSDNILDSIKNTNAEEVILRQSSGFVGLYSRNGILIRSINLLDGSNPVQKISSSPYQSLMYRDQRDYNYPVGSKIDPYQAETLVYPKNNHANLSPGWGYNSQIKYPSSKRSAIVSFLNFAPLDTVTPLNYPGYFDQSGLTFAYGFGVIPHIGGLIANLARSNAEKKDYEYYKTQQPPNYIEAPTTYYRGNPYEQTNPINIDPRFYGLDLSGNRP